MKDAKRYSNRNVKPSSFSYQHSCHWRFISFSGFSIFTQPRCERVRDHWTIFCRRSMFDCFPGVCDHFSVFKLLINSPSARRKSSRSQQVPKVWACYRELFLFHPLSDSISCVIQGGTYTLKARRYWSDCKAWVTWILSRPTDFLNVNVGSVT